MKKNIHFEVRRVLLYMIIMLIFAGCSGDAISRIESEQGSTQSTRKFIATTTESIKIPTTTPQIISKLTKTMEKSPTPNVTLTEGEVAKRVNGLLSNNSNCMLPCIWGFKPGETKINSVLDFFSEFGWGMYKYEREKGYVFYTGKELNSTEKISLGFYGNNETLEGISYGLVDPLFYGRENWLSLANIFESYGTPDEVWVSVNLSGEMSIDLHKSAGYEVYLFYKNPLILIDYHGFASHINNTFSICLLSKDNPDYNQSDGIRYISVFTGSKNVIATPTRIMEPFGKFNGRLSIKDTFNISIQQFQNLILTKDDQPCLSTPDNIWEQ